MTVGSESQLPVIIQSLQQQLEVFIYNFSADDNYTLAESNQGVIEEEEDGIPFPRNMSGFWGNESEYVVPRISAEIQIGLYTLIFLLAVVGNLLVLVTLFQNKRMRTVTNVFLLNLALSDLLLAVFCMPFTLVPVLLRNFIFGAAMCVLIRYLQAVSVGVSCFTLVAISLERYFAICRPLHSRSWQTLSHAYRCLGLCWLLAGLLMLPVAVFQRHEHLSKGAHACRENWPSLTLAQAYTVLLDLALLVVPLLLMTLAYVSVVHALVYDVRVPSFKRRSGRDGEGEVDEGEEETVVPPDSPPKDGVANHRTIELRLLARDSVRSNSSVVSTESCLTRSSTLVSGAGSPSRAPLPRPAPLNNTSLHARRSGRHHNRLRHSNPRKIRENKIRVVRMLFVVVLEFFLCWTPLYVIQTWMIFDVDSAYEVVTPMTKTLFHLLSYVSSCCNPITYCFMNKKFREGFMRVFTCRKPPAPLKDRQRQLLVVQSSRRGVQSESVSPPVSGKLSLKVNCVRHYELANNINTIEEQSTEDGS